MRLIFNYIALQLKAPAAAERMAAAFRKAIAGLSKMPERHPPVANGYRKIIVKNYIVLYKVDNKNKAVSIMRVLHSKQNRLDILQ